MLVIIMQFFRWFWTEIQELQDSLTSNSKHFKILFGF